MMDDLLPRHVMIKKVTKQCVSARSHMSDTRKKHCTALFTGATTRGGRVLAVLGVHTEVKTEETS